jgi:hypothetical protein
MTFWNRYGGTTRKELSYSRRHHIICKVNRYISRYVAGLLFRIVHWLEKRR